MFHADKGSVTVGGKNFDARALEYSLGTPPDGVSGPLVAVPDGDTSGCTPPTTTGCRRRARWCWWIAASARSRRRKTPRPQRGAVAMIVVDNVDEQQMGGTLGADTDVKIPVVSVTKSDGVLLRAAAWHTRPSS